MSKVDHMSWSVFLSNESDTLMKEEQELLARLHAKYFKHSYYLPCTCSPKTYNTWIEQLNVIYNNGQ
jgi:imidazoleglycerol phosphate synthase glutamine amidotransferase subunit HisH